MQVLSAQQKSVSLQQSPIAAQHPLVVSQLPCVSSLHAEKFGSLVVLNPNGVSNPSTVIHLPSYANCMEPIN